MSSTIHAFLKPHQHDVGGLTVRRVLPALAARTVGPFIFFDHMGPATLAPGMGLDVRPHPHIGLATVTYLFEGAIMHRDSLGSRAEDRPRRRQLDDRRTRHRPFRAHARRGPRAPASRCTASRRGSRCRSPTRRSSRRSSITRRATLPLIERDGVTLRVIAGSAFGAARAGARSRRRSMSPREFAAGRRDRRSTPSTRNAACISSTAISRSTATPLPERPDGRAHAGRRRRRCASANGARRDAARRRSRSTASASSNGISSSSSREKIDAREARVERAAHGPRARRDRVHSAAAAAPRGSQAPEA